MISKSFWHGKSVLVTGGSSGIGRAIGLAAVASGSRVGIIARKRPPLEAALADLRSRGAIAEAIACDVADAEGLRAAVTMLEERLGSCDVAIACAGIHRTSWPLDAASAGEVIDVNAKGCINLAAAVLPGMLARRRGSFCGVASIAAVVGLPGNAAYCASKAAVVAFLESLRLDCQPAGVEITTACPGVVDTPMVTDAERASGRLITAAAAATLILRGIERGRAEIWFPRRTALAARLARSLPATIRDWVLRRQPRLAESSQSESSGSESSGDESSDRG